MISILYPWAFLLLLAPIVVYNLFKPVKGMHGDALRVPFVKDVAKINIISGSLWSRSYNAVNSKKIWNLMFLAWVFMTIAVARPQWVGEPIRLNNIGYDILMITDISNSMREADFSYQGRQIDRFTAVKIAADGFIKKRPNDRIGLILFGSRAYLQSPITFDKAAISNILWSTDAGMAGTSTAIGDAVGLALKTLRKEKDKTGDKIIILLTDGENNDGSLSMPEVLKLAKDENIKIYTIGVGSESRLISSFFGIKVPQATGLDEQSLRQLATETKGSYFRASDTKGLQKIYQEIDDLEASIDEDRFIQDSKDLYFYPLLVSLIITFIALLFYGRRGK